MAPRTCPGLLRSLGFLLLVVPAPAYSQVSEPKALVAGLCDYVAADYPNAVKDGQVIAPQEYAEQEAMLVEAEKQASSVAPALVAQVKQLQALFANKAPEAELVVQARAIRKALVQRYGLVLTPPAAPSRARAEALYKTACAACHGDDGRAQTPRAAELKPPPVSFFDEEKMSRVSPALAYHAISFGVGGTGMAAFDALPVPDRWSLAYLVVSMRHTPVDDARGKALFHKSWAPMSPVAAAIAQESDAQLDTLLAPGLPDARERRQTIAWLRTTASFREQWDGTFADARRQLAQVAAHAGDRKKALQLAIAAYINGVEPHEAELRTRDRAAGSRIEHGFAQLRAAIQAGAGEGEIRAEVARVDLILRNAPVKERVPFWAALAIGLRQGFELSLLLAGLLVFLRKSGRSQLARWVHLGWGAALVAGLATWFVIGTALGSAARRELAQGILTLVAAAMLLYVGHLARSRPEPRKWLNWLLVTVAFIAAYREAIEIVLFFRARALAGPGAGLAIAAGAATGIALLAALVPSMQLVAKRLNPRAAMLASSVALTVIAISLLGQGVRSLQEGGHLHVLPVLGSARLPFLGIHPTVEGLATQTVALLLVLLLARRIRTTLWVRVLLAGAIGGLAAGSARAETVYRTPRQTLAEFFPRSQQVRFLRFPVDAPLRDRLTQRLGYGPRHAEYVFYLATSGNHIDGYALIDDELGQSEPITFAVQLSPDGAVERTEILVYREPRGDEVRSRRFLDQLRGKTLRQPVRTGVDIDAVSGATISSRSLATGVRRSLVLFDELILRTRVSTRADAR